MHRESPFVQLLQLAAQSREFDCNYSVEAAMHRESPFVQLLQLAAQSMELLEMPVGQQVAGLLLLRATVPAGQLQLVRPLGVG